MGIGMYQDLHLTHYGLYDLLQSVSLSSLEDESE